MTLPRRCHQACSQPALFIALGLLCAGAAWAVPPDSTKVVGRITIQNLGVFDPRLPQYNRLPYTLLNHLHIRTRPAVIRRELLFSPGGAFDEELVEESARNLRKFPFLGHVAITPSARMDTVDLVVQTEDQWTSVPDVVIDRQGELSRWGIGIKESNFLGFGKSFDLRFLTSTDRNLARFIYEDPGLLRSHLTLRIAGVKSSEGQLADVRLSRPQYALRTRWSFEAGFHYEKGIFRLYESGRQSAALGNGRQDGDLSMGRVWGDRGFQQKFTLRFTGERLSYDDHIDLFLPAALSAQDLLATGPVSRRQLRLEAAWECSRFRFVKKRAIDRAGVVEDLKVGPRCILVAGQAIGSREGRDSYGLLSASLVEAAAIGDDQVVIFSAAGSVHVASSRLSNKTFTLFYHHYYQGLPHQTIAFSAALDQALAMDQPFQLVLGGDVGLRGYPARQFTGDRLLLFNLEDRIFTPVELGTVRLGCAVFGDAGMVWPAGQAARWQDLRSSAGLSLRLGVVKFSGAPVFRFDLPFPLRRDPGVSRWAIGFSFSPVFWSFGGPDDLVKRFR